MCAKLGDRFWLNVVFSVERDLALDRSEVNAEYERGEGAEGYRNTFYIFLSKE